LIGKAGAPEQASDLDRWIARHASSA
jgi:hypothetical protein